MTEVPYFFRLEIDNEHVQVYRTRKRTLVDKDTGEEVDDPQPVTHASAIGLGDYMLTDDEPVLDENGKQTGTISVPRLGPDGLPQYDTDAYKAAVQAAIVAHAGDGLAQVIADKATQTAAFMEIKRQAEAAVADANAKLAAGKEEANAYLQSIQAQVAQAVQDAQAEARATIDAANAQAATIVTDAQTRADTITTAAVPVDATPLAEPPTPMRAG